MLESKMEKIGADSGTGNLKQISTEDEYQLANEHYMTCLVHACKCKDADCRFHDCHKMKNIVQHCKRCSKQKTNSGCPICKQYFALCCLHARHCQETEACPIPFCDSIKHKLKVHIFRQKLRQTQNWQRHAGVMRNRRMSGGLLEPNPENSNPSSPPLLGAQPHPSSHTQLDTGMKSSSGPPIGALIAVQQVQAAAARQAAQAQIHNPMSQMSGIPNYMLNTENGASWGNVGYAQNHQLHQNTQPLPNPQLGLQQTLQAMGGPNSMYSSIDSTMGSPQVMPNPGHSVDDMQNSKQDWQQLFQILRISSANSPPQPFSFPEN